MKRKRLFPVIIAVTIFVVVVLTILVASSWYLDKFVKTKLQDELYNQTNGEYSLTIHSLKLNLLSQSIIFNDVTFKPETSTPEKATYTGSAKQIKFGGLGILKFFLAREINVHKIEFVDPNVTITQSLVNTPDHDTTKDFSLYNFISSFTNSIAIGSFNLTNFDFKLYSKPGDSIASLHSNNNHFKVINFYVGEETKNLEGMFRADTIALIMNRFEYTTTDSLYTFNVEKMRVSYADSVLKVDSIEVIPNYNKQRFAEIAGKQTDRFNIFAQTLEFNKINLKHFFERHGLIVRSLDITNFNLTAFRDKNDDRHFDIPKSVQALLKEAPIYINIDTLSIFNSFIAYEEVAPGKELAGRITFNEIYGEMIGLTNDSVKVADNHKIEFRAVCKLLNSAKLSAFYTFPMNTSQMVFDCSGFLTDLPMNELNPMIEPNVGISINEGIIDTLDFSFHAEENSSTGTMKFIYRDLKLQVPESDKHKTKGIGGFTLFLANTFVLKENNPSGNRPPRISSIHFVRNKQRFMFHYTWNSIFSGIKETVGVPQSNKNK